MALDDVNITAIQTSERGLFTDLELIRNNGQQYSLTTSVRAGDLVRKTHLSQTVKVYSLKRDILRGEAITASDVSVSNVSLASSYPNQRFPLSSLLKHAKALRDLTQGSVLSRRDFGIRHQVLMTTGSISRGQKINSANAETSNYFGHLPSDVALKLADVNMEATRSLKADQLIKIIRLKALCHV